MAKNGKMAKLTQNGNKWQKWQKMAKWRMGHLNFFIMFELKSTNMDSIWMSLALKWRKMAKMAKNGNKWQNGRKWPKMADGSFELFYRISAEKNEYRLHFYLSSHEMAKNGGKIQNGKMAEINKISVRAPQNEKTLFSKC